MFLFSTVVTYIFTENKYLSSDIAGCPDYNSYTKEETQFFDQLRSQPIAKIITISLKTTSTFYPTSAIGDAKSQQVLQQSLDIANKIQAKTQLSSILSSLGKNASDLQDPETALNYFEDAEKAATNPNELLQAGLARFKLLVDYDKLEYAIALAPQLQQQLGELQPSHNSLYAAINFAATLNKLAKPNQVLPGKDLAQLMAATVKSAQQMQDAPAEAHALHQWAQLYHRNSQFREAKELADKSLNIARQLQADDIIAQSAWQVGKLYQQENKRAEAISAYTEAVKSLKALRSDLSAANVFEENRQQSLDAGAAAFIPKPLQRDELLHGLRSH